jgi:choline dehydrogenase-like flavoprotein
MPLPELVPGPSPVEVQHTTFSADAVGRYVCSTWQEAVHNGGAPFSMVVVGAGMYGAYLAARLFRRNPAARVLLLDAGPWLLPEHVQNLPRLDFDVPAAIAPQHDPGTARAHVWGLPWRGNVEFPGLAYCTGGKSVYWGGWCPRLTAGDLQHWPADVAQYLDAHYVDVESETGVVPANDFIFGELADALRPACEAAAASMSNLEHAIGTHGVQVAPLAVQGSAPTSGLFSFDKFSAVPLLVEAVRDAVRLSGVNDAARALFFVPRVHVIKLHTAGSAVSGLEVDVSGTRQFLPVSPHCAVVLAASAVESTRLALHAFPTPLMGRNLMAHVRSDFTVRIRRAAWPALPAHVQTAAQLVRGLSPSGRFHIQITASTHQHGSDELLFRMIPDLDVLDAHLASHDPEWVTLTLRGVGEMQGHRLSGAPSASTSWIDLSPYESDEFDAPRAYVHLTLQPADLAVWQAMDQAALTLAQRIAGSASHIEYLYDGGWKSQPFPLQRPFPEWHRGLGTTYHESGTLWMGTAPTNSVTDTHGRFHHVSNAYACDQSIFPTVGSANPVLTGLTLARQLADHLAG